MLGWIALDHLDIGSPVCSCLFNILVTLKEKILIVSYYWPPSGGSGVQRWMYFARYLDEMGFEPIILTVDPKVASYKTLDESLVDEVAHLKTYTTNTREPLKLYSLLTSGSKTKGIPQGNLGKEFQWHPATNQPVHPGQFFRS